MKKLRKIDKRLYFLTGIFEFVWLIAMITDFVNRNLGKVFLLLFPLLICLLVVLFVRQKEETEEEELQILSKYICEAVPMPILIINKDHTIQNANPFACTFFDTSLEEMADQSLEKFVTNSFFSLKVRFEEEVKKRNENYDVSVTCRESNIVCSIKYHMIYNENGEYRFAILIVNDMSKQYAMYHKLEASRSRAEIASQAKSAFLTNMSHEIRTPLNVILGMNEMIVRESTEPGMLEYADNINEAANSMVNMINDILDMSKMENGKLEMINVDYDIRKMVGQIMESIKNKMKGRNLEIDCIIDPQMPNCLWGDEVRIRQIINKFLSNAEKYTKEGRITLRIRGEFKEREKINLTVEVEDTGIGIPQEDFDKLFVAFDRIDLKKNRSIAGLGLGLTIVKNVVEAMDGEVSVESEYGKGSTFSFTIPQQVTATTLVGDFNEWYNSLVVLESGKEARNLLAPEAKILAVDDTNVNLEVVKALLKRTQMHVDVAHSGAECLEMVTKKEYHIILMDHMMPEMDGIETLQKLKTMGNNLSVGAVVIALTANAVAGARETYLASGFDDYLKKPIKSVKLEQMLVKYLPQELVQIQEGKNSSITSEEWASMVEFENINVRTGLIYTDQDHEMLQGIMKQFLNTGKKNLEELEYAINQQDWKTYGILVHALKSTSLNIGAERLSTHAKMLEAAVKKDRIEYLLANHGRVVRLYQSILEELNEYFEEVSIGEHKEIQSEPILEIEAKELSELLVKLRDKLEISITTEIEKVANQLKKYSFDGKTLKEYYKEIFNYIDEYEYEEAYSLVEEVIKKNG